MIERVTIYGDSFADPISNDPSRWQEITWYGLLRKRWPETQNYGKSGSGPMYSFKKFYESLHSFTHEDLIVFVVLILYLLHYLIDLIGFDINLTL